MRALRQAASAPSTTGTTYFADDTTWIDAARQTHCDLQGTAGATLKHWLFNAITNPASATDAVEEGSLATVQSGVNSFTCSVAP